MFVPDPGITPGLYHESILSRRYFPVCHRITGGLRRPFPVKALQKITVRNLLGDGELQSDKLKSEVVPVIREHQIHRQMRVGVQAVAVRCEIKLFAEKEYSPDEGQRRGSGTYFIGRVVVGQAGHRSDPEIVFPVHRHSTLVGLQRGKSLQYTVGTYIAGGEVEAVKSFFMACPDPAQAIGDHKIKGVGSQSLLCSEVPDGVAAVLLHDARQSAVGGHPDRTFLICGDIPAFAIGQSVVNGPVTPFAGAESTGIDPVASGSPQPVTPDHDPPDILFHDGCSPERIGKMKVPETINTLFRGTPYPATVIFRQIVDDLLVQHGGITEHLHVFLPDKREGGKACRPDIPLPVLVDSRDGKIGQTFLFAPFSELLVVVHGDARIASRPDISVAVHHHRENIVTHETVAIPENLKGEF